MHVLSMTLQFLKASFRPRNNMPSLSAGYTQFCVPGLQESWPEKNQHAPKLLAARASPPHPTGALLQGPYLVVRGACRPSSRTPSPGWALHGLRARLAHTMLISLWR